MHADVWQEYDQGGRRLLNGGRPSALGNPEPPVYYGGVATIFYRYAAGEIELLFQRRSQTVDNFPGEWDVSSGGHINYREPVIAAAAREANEELGVDISEDDLRFGFSYCHKNRFVYVYFCDWTGKSDEFRCPDGEVDDTRWVKLIRIDDFCQTSCKPPLKEDNLWIPLTKEWLSQYANHRH